MKKSIALILALAAGLILQSAPADAGRRSLAPACKYEDSRNCVWDARHRGNGEGRSYIDRNGRTIYISHRAAHALTH